MLICWQEETKSCYEDAEKWPLEKKQDGGDEYTVSFSTLISAKMSGNDVTVYIIYGTYALSRTTMLKLCCKC